MRNTVLIFLFCYFTLYVLSCQKDNAPNGDTPDMQDTTSTNPNDTTGNNVLDSTYTQTAYQLNIPNGFPQPIIPPDNPLTNEGVLLGRMLFYDPILSADSTMSCATCHRQENAFADPRTTSPGIDGINGTRNSMPLFNLAYGLNQPFTWDGSKATLEQQSLEPITNPIELHQSLPDLIAKLKAHPNYPLRFAKAFNAAPSEDLAAKAISQFMRTLISANSRFDQFQTSSSNPTELEAQGYNIFITENGMLGEAECFHCHFGGGKLFTEFAFKNNGLDAVENHLDFPDPGLGAVTGVPEDYGKFKTPSLRNIALTPPYMHDGRFATLEEVIDHYSNGIHNSPTLSPELGSEYTTGENVNFTPEEKAALIAFLHTLTDSSFITNPAFSNPFE